MSNFPFRHNFLSPGQERQRGLIRFCGGPLSSARTRQLFLNLEGKTVGIIELWSCLFYVFK
jgi:hypothetical protein